VLSTLHTNTAIGAITRLRDMGVEPFLLSSSLIGVMAQRLVRVLCPHCKQSHMPTADECMFLEISPQNPQQIYTAQGCERCSKTGYSGRTGIYEVLLLDNELKLMIHDNAGESEMGAYIRTIYPSIRQDGLLRILAGHTTIEEVIRVTSE
jgi:general secretion pathway protein E